MNSIRATCPLCDTQVDVKPRDVVLHLVNATTTAANRYGFFCPDCDIFAVRPASQSVVELLLQGNVALATGPEAPWDVAELPGMVLIEARIGEELAAALRTPDLTIHDVDNFVYNLTDDALAAWLTD